ncbi:MAG: hypothetical protein RIA69_02125 [Cyclobacteriaceae bacterium]
MSNSQPAKTQRVDRALYLPRFIQFIGLLFGPESKTHKRFLHKINKKVLGATLIDDNHKQAPSLSDQMKGIIIGNRHEQIKVENN